MTTDPSSAISLGRRLSRRAVDLLVIAFLVSVGVSTGQQLMDWWRVDPKETGPDLSEFKTFDFDWGHTPVKLQFGDASTSLERIPFQGARKSLDEELTRIGQGLVTNSVPRLTPIDEAEQGLLKALQGVAPVFWDSTQGNVYRRHQPFPSFVSTRLSEPDTAESEDAEAIVQRIVGWGLAFPTAPGEWVIYVFHPETDRSPLQEGPVDFQLPPASQNITTLNGRDGSQWRVIQGRGDFDGWVQHFDRQFGTDAILSRVVGDQTASIKYRRNGFVTDLQIRIEPNGLLTSVIWSAKERDRP